MNDHNRPLFKEKAFDGIPETESQFQELYVPVNETPRLCAEIKDILLVNEMNDHKNSMTRQLINFQEWKLRLIDKNSLHFGISFFI